MQSAELQPGRTLGVVLAPGDDILGAIAAACTENGIRQAFITTFIGAFRAVRLIAAESPPDHEEPPMRSEVTVPYSEGVGSGTVVRDPVTGEPVVHLHLAVGVKGRGGAAYAGHVLGGEVHYVTEVLLLEIAAPTMGRSADSAAYGLPRLAFG
jgi:predicted DNA-binding protein with PD1-like motif